MNKIIVLPYVGNVENEVDEYWKSLTKVNNTNIYY